MGVLGKIFAIDFDGTLYSGNTPFPQVDETQLNTELIHAIETCQRLFPQDRYILWTCREGHEIAEALEALNKVSNIKWSAINDNIEEVKQSFGDPRKIIADVYIDDRAASPIYGVRLLQHYALTGGEFHG